MMNEGRLDEGKMSCARAWKVSIVLTAAVACLSILHSSFYNVSSDRFFSSTKSTSLREAKTTPASRSDDSKLAKSGSALVDSGSVMMSTTYKSMCVHIGSQSAFSLWKLHAAQILKASQLPADPQFAQHDMMLEMLNKISPRLPHSHQSLTRAWKTVEHVLSVAWERYQYLQQIKNPVTSTLQRKEPPLVRIVVVGGSVTLGHKCSAINDVKEIPCSWVARLETLLNGLAGGALVQVHNSAIGASTSETGQAIWDHEILPDEAKNPDILINAYSTNDSHPSRGTRDKKSAMAQSFVRSILTPLTCSKPPLLIWLDDYIGNVAQGIKEMTLLSQEVQVLASYYGFSFVSFANVVRDWVYGDNHGTLFTPPWYSADGQFVTEVHPGQGMHIATMWIMAYNFLNLATTHCSVVNWSSQTNHNSTGSSFMHPFNTSDQIKIPESTYYQPVPSSLPPALTDALTLKDVTDMWRNDARALEKHPKVCSPNRTSRCIFSWVSGLEWQESIATIQKKFAPFVVEQGKWRVIDDTGRRKFGWVPAEKGSKLLFEFQNLTQTVRTVTLFPMKSYGEKWRNSNARFRFLSKSSEAMDWLELTSLEIPGLHSTTTSEIYTIPVHMPSEIPANSNLRISMTMTNGTTYKLMGLTLCS